MVTFDQVLPTLLQVCDAFPEFSGLRQSCVVRDLRGRVRLVLDPDPARATLDFGALNTQLSDALGGYFVPPAWCTSPSGTDQSRLARTVLARAETWLAEYEDPGTGATKTPTVPWKKMERRLSKQEWLESSSEDLPWPLAASTPAIVTFYSFKGGVGRTTALASCAWQLARAGERVVVIDLDLEAPGAGTLFEAEAERGIVDFLVDHLATGSTDLTGMVSDARGLGSDGERVQVLGTGRLDTGYLEKLGRLDFLASHPDPGPAPTASPIELSLKALLKVVRKKLNPTFILIDSRAGLHDLAGLSLHRLAHVDVLVARANEQGYRGLDLTLGVLARRKTAERLQCVIAHSLAPGEGLAEAVAEETEFSTKSYGFFEKHVYTGARAGTIGANDEGPHRPVVLRYDAALARFSSLRTLETQLFAPGFKALREKIEALTATSEEAE